MTYPLKNYELRLKKDGRARCFDIETGDPFKSRTEIWLNGVCIKTTPFEQYAVGFTDGYNKKR